MVGPGGKDTDMFKRRHSWQKLLAQDLHSALRERMTPMAIIIYIQTVK